MVSLQPLLGDPLLLLRLLPLLPPRRRRRHRGRRRRRGGDGRKEKGGESVPRKSHNEGLAACHQVQGESGQQKCLWVQQSRRGFRLCHERRRALAATVSSCSFISLNPPL